MLSYIGAETGAFRPIMAARTAGLPACAAIRVSPCHRLLDGALAGAELTHAPGDAAVYPAGQARLLRAACQEASAWAAVRPCAALLGVTVAVPGHSMRGGLLAQVEAALSRAGLSGSRLSVALPQAELEDAGPDLLLLVAALRDLGADVALDSQAEAGGVEQVLRRLPLTAVRLHPAVVRKAEGDPDARAALSRVIRLAHRSDCRAVALGVNTVFQRDILADLHCDAAQGRLFGQDLPGSVFRAGLD